MFERPGDAAKRAEGARVMAAAAAGAGAGAGAGGGGGGVLPGSVPATNSPKPVSAGASGSWFGGFDTTLNALFASTPPAEKKEPPAASSAV